MTQKIMKKQLEIRKKLFNIKMHIKFVYNLFYKRNLLEYIFLMDFFFLDFYLMPCYNKSKQKGKEVIA